MTGVCILPGTRVIELQPEGLTDFQGGYEDYLKKQGIVADSP